MAIKNSNSSNKQLFIGNVFTPVKWGFFAIEKFGLFDKWIEGATIFDPTMGEGNLLESLIEYGLSKGFSINELPCNRLFGNDLNAPYYQSALQKFKQKYNIDLSDNFTNEDIIFLPEKKFDIIFGNPPWCNFTDLPDDYKNQIKHAFIQYQLVSNPQSLLLGGSRIDIAALVIQKSVYHHLKENGEAIFFIPLSLFLNDGANNYFRKYKIHDVSFSLECIYDFKDENIFPDISTRYGLAHFVRDKTTNYPIHYFILKKNNWEKNYAKPIVHPTDPLKVYENNDTDAFSSIQPILLTKESVPRQGINTCGANAIFIFDFCELKNNNLVLVKNKHIEETLLPQPFVYPLITSHQFKDDTAEPKKWILLPYHKNGSILEWKEIQAYKELEKYLLQFKNKLESRKGTLLQGSIKRGYWWALLGVGKYNFFPYKIVWEAYGRATFEPKIFEGHWQANQSLQAYIPVKNYDEARRILSQLKSNRIENYLLSMKMEGTMNWAQPGKIKRLIQFTDEPLKLL